MPHAGLLSAVAVLTLTALSFAAYAGDETDLPQSVTFQAMRTSGVLGGCSIVYAAPHPPRITPANQEIVILVGSIGVMRGGEGQLLAFLKAGLSDGEPTHRAKPPHFAYLLTKSANTTKATRKTTASDEGFLIVGGAFDETWRKAILELLEAGRVEIGFNGAEGELDSTLSLNLRATSADTPLQFINCLQDLMGEK